MCICPFWSQHQEGRTIEEVVREKKRQVSVPVSWTVIPETGLISDCMPKWMMGSVCGNEAE